MLRTLSALAVLALTAGQALAQNADFILTNATGYPISEVFVSPTNTKSWGADVLGKHTIGNGESWKLSFPQSKEQCVQDLQIVFEDDNSKVVWEGLNLCEIDKLTITYDRKTGVTSVRKE